MFPVNCNPAQGLIYPILVITSLTIKAQLILTKANPSNDTSSNLLPIAEVACPSIQIDSSQQKIYTVKLHPNKFFYCAEGIFKLIVANLPSLDTNCYSVSFNRTDKPNVNGLCIVIQVTHFHIKFKCTSPSRGDFTQQVFNWSFIFNYNSQQFRNETITMYPDPVEKDHRGEPALASRDSRFMIKGGEMNGLDSVYLKAQSGPFESAKSECNQPSNESSLDSQEINCATPRLDGIPRNFTPSQEIKLSLYSHDSQVNFHNNPHLQQVYTLDVQLKRSQVQGCRLIVWLNNSQFDCYVTISLYLGSENKTKVDCGPVFKLQDAYFCEVNQIISQKWARYFIIHLCNGIPLPGTINYAWTEDYENSYSYLSYGAGSVLIPYIIYFIASQWIFVKREPRRGYPISAQTNRYPLAISKVTELSS